jgi:ribosome biogenesis protein Tsr3
VGTNSALLLAQGVAGRVTVEADMASARFCEASTTSDPLVATWSAAEAVAAKARLAMRREALNMVAGSWRRLQHEVFWKVGRGNI